MCSDELSAWCVLLWVSLWGTATDKGVRYTVSTCTAVSLSPGRVLYNRRHGCCKRKPSVCRDCFRSFGGVGFVDFGTSYATLWHESTDSCSRQRWGKRNKIYSEGFFLSSIMTSNEGILLSWVGANTHGPKQSLLLGVPKLMNQIKLPDNFEFFVYLFNSSWKSDHQWRTRRHVRKWKSIHLHLWCTVSPALMCLLGKMPRLPSSGWWVNLFCSWGCVPMGWFWMDFWRY